MPYTARLLFLLFAMASSVFAASTSELNLKNGDRIRGELVKKADGRITFRSESFGEIQIPESSVASIDPITAGSGQKASAVAKASSSTANASIPPLLAKTSSKGWRKVLSQTKGMMEFGFNDQSGRQQSVDMSLRADAEYIVAPDAYRVSWRALYGHANGAPHTDKREASFRWRHDLIHQLFVQYTSSYSDDRIKQIDVNLEQSADLGWKAYNKHDQVLNVGAGTTVQYRKTLGIDEGSLVLGNLFHDYSWKITDRISFKEESSAQYSPVSRSSYTIINGQMLRTDAQATNYRFRFNGALQGKISERFTVSLRYDYDYDNTIVIPTLRADQRLSSTIGYVF